MIDVIRYNAQLRKVTFCHCWKSGEIRVRTYTPKRDSLHRLLAAVNVATDRNERVMFGLAEGFVSHLK